MINTVKNIIKYMIYKKRNIKIPYKNLHNISYNANIGDFCEICNDTIIATDVNIGEYTFMNMRNIIRSGHIGRFCSIGQDCLIGPQEHPVDSFITHSLMYEENKLGIRPKTCAQFKQKNPPKIGDNVWIGAKSIVLNGVNIGEGAIIGANSLVNSDIPPYAVAVGSPARVIYNRKEKYNLKDLHLGDMNTIDIIKLIESGII